MASSTDLAEVIVPAFDPEQVYAEAPWPARGTDLPAEGDRCVLVMADTDIPGTPEPWIVSWWNDSAPTFPTSGGGGSGGVAFEEVHVASTPVITWIITHTLGRPPGNVRVVNNAGTEVLVEVQDTGTNQISIHFGAPFTGKAYLI